MPKILKTVTAEGIYNTPALQRLVDSGKYFGEYNALADNGEVFIIRGSSDIKEWYAWRCISPSVGEKTNFTKMLTGYETTGEVSKKFKTKKALTTAIEEGTAGFEPWNETPWEFIKSGQAKNDRDWPVTPGATASSSSGPKLPGWVWFLLLVIVVAIIVNAANS